MDVNDHSIEVRSKAIGMFKAGLTMKIVAEKLNVSFRSVQRLSRLDILGQSMETLPRNGRPKILSRIPKIIILKLWGKEGSRPGATSFEVVRLNLTTNVQFLATARNVKKFQAVAMHGHPKDSPNMVNIYIKLLEI